VGRNSTVVADLDTGGINETKSRALTKTLAQIAAQGNQSGWYPFDKTVVTDQPWKSTTPIATDQLRVKPLEIAVRRLMERNQNRHDLA
jgi:hypothetical protein